MPSATNTTDRGEADTPAPGLVIDAFQPMTVGALKGFADISMGSGLRLLRCSVFLKDGRSWVAPPARQIVGRDGVALRTSDGRPRYEPCVSFRDRATADRWSGAVIAALRVAFPEALA